MWGRHTNLAIAEYWRWWVVHLWVEGFFEVFATVVIAFLFTRLGLVRPRTAAAAALFSATIFLSGGIIGTLPPPLLLRHADGRAGARGRCSARWKSCRWCWSASRRGENLRLSPARRRGCAQYQWPIYFFVAVAFWNLVGAGLFGFMINPPIALYYMQGLNTTPRARPRRAVRRLRHARHRPDAVLPAGADAAARRGRPGRCAFAFWAINIGLWLMVRPEPAAGRADADLGVRRARQLVRPQSPSSCRRRRWRRCAGCGSSATRSSPLGIVALGWFVLGLKTGWSIRAEEDSVGAGLAARRGRSADPAVWHRPPGRQSIRVDDPGSLSCTFSDPSSVPTARGGRDRKEESLMAIPHAQPGEVIDVRPLGPAWPARGQPPWSRPRAWRSSGWWSPGARRSPPTRPGAEITVQCLEGRVAFTTGGVTHELGAGQLLYLAGEQPHSVRGIDDASLLLTITSPRSLRSDDAFLPLPSQFHQGDEPAEVAREGVGERLGLGEEAGGAGGQGEGERLLAEVDPEQPQRHGAGAGPGGGEAAEDLAQDRVVVGADRLGGQDQRGQADDQAAAPAARPRRRGHVQGGTGR